MEMGARPGGTAKSEMGGPQTCAACAPMDRGEDSPDVMLAMLTAPTDPVTPTTAISTAAGTTLEELPTEGATASSPQLPLDQTPPGEVPQRHALPCTDSIGHKRAEGLRARRPRFLELFSGEGTLAATAASMGFEVTTVDIRDGPGGDLLRRVSLARVLEGVTSGLGSLRHPVHNLLQILCDVLQEM